jgi:TatD DNase family protein
LNNPYINIHTHHHSDETDVISLLNTDAAPSSETANALVTIGVHPWHIQNTTIDFIKKNAGNKKVVAIGECGLDKLIDTDIKTQVNVFIEQIKIAELHKKPLIIHCVKAFDDLIRIKKALQISVPMVVHGFNNNEQIAKELIKNGFYISLGKALLIEDSNASKIIKQIPSHQLFLETDDADISIKRIFETASQRLSIQEAQLKNLIFQNFKKMFQYE